MKKISFFLILFISSLSAKAQSISKATIGSIGGQFKNGNILLSFTLGETLVGNQSNGNIKLGFGFWSVVPAGYVSIAITVYRFTGNGNFNNPANWEGGLVPPSPLPANAEVIIAPVESDAQCILNIPFQVAPGGKFSVMAGKKFIVPGLLNLQ